MENVQLKNVQQEKRAAERVSQDDVQLNDFLQQDCLQLRPRS